MSTKKERKRRRNLWEKDPRCFYCHRKLTWEESTLEHLNSKVKRRKRPQTNKPATVLACAPCNQQRAEEERKSMPRWYWWVRSRSFPKLSRSDLSPTERMVILLYKPIVGEAQR